MKKALLAAALFLFAQAPVRAEEPLDLVKELVTILVDLNQTEQARVTAIRQLQSLKAVDKIPLLSLITVLDTVNPSSALGTPKLASEVVALTAQRGPHARAAVPTLVKLKGRGGSQLDQELDRALDQILPPPDTSREAVAALMRQLNDRDASVRLRAVKALGMKGSGARDAVPLLVEASKNDPDEDVRRVAAAAIVKIQGTSPGR